jgi:hypothetical protein
MLSCIQEAALCTSRFQLVSDYSSLIIEEMNYFSQHWRRAVFDFLLLCHNMWLYHRDKFAMSCIVWKLPIAATMISCSSLDGLDFYEASVLDICTLNVFSNPTIFRKSVRSSECVVLLNAFPRR